MAVFTGCPNLQDERGEADSRRSFVDTAIPALALWHMLENAFKLNVIS